MKIDHEYTDKQWSDIIYDLKHGEKKNFEDLAINERFTIYGDQHLGYNYPKICLCLKTGNTTYSEITEGIPLGVQVMHCTEHVSPIGDIKMYRIPHLEGTVPPVLVEDVKMPIVYLDGTEDTAMDLWEDTYDTVYQYPTQIEHELNKVIDKTVKRTVSSTPKPSRTELRTRRNKKRKEKKQRSRRR